MSDDALPEPDRLDGAPHPRETAQVFGHAGAEAEVLDALRAGRMHHAWLIAGPEGIGKATLAWRIARALLAEAPADAGLFGDAPAPPESLDIDPDSAIAHRIAAGSEPRLFVLRRGPTDDRKRLSADIRVGEVRRLNGFFGLSAADGGRRVVIVDAADELNTNAANALLKLLEEPPAQAVLILVAHQPARLLPTIRSRCRTLLCRPLGPEDLAAALRQAGVEPGTETGALGELAGGSVRRAIGLLSQDGLAIYAGLVTLFSGAPALDRAAAQALATRATQRGQEARLDLTFDLFDQMLSRLARHGAGHAAAVEAAPGEAALFARLAPDAGAARAWAQLQAELTGRIAHGRAVNLDPSALILDMILKANETAAALQSRQ